MELRFAEDPSKIKPKRTLPKTDLGKESAIRGNPEILTGGLSPEAPDINLVKDFIKSELNKLLMQNPERASAINITIDNLEKPGGAEYLQSLADDIKSRGNEVTPQDVADVYLAKYYQQFKTKKQQDAN